MEQFEVISSYSRAQAIEDGVLVDVSEVAREGGFKWPCVITTGVHALIEKAVGSPKHCNDYQGVLWDILTMARHACLYEDKAIENPGRTRQLPFKVIINGCGRRRYQDMKIACGPGDTVEPVLTIMLPGED